MAWKVYTGQPLVGNLSLPLLRACSDYEAYMVSGQAEVWIRYLYTLAAHALTNFRDVRRVFVQVFVLPDGALPTRYARPKGIRLVEGRWYLGCWLDKDPSHAVQVSQPYVSLVLENLPLWKHGTFIFDDLPRSQWELIVSVHGHIKPWSELPNTLSLRSPAPDGVVDQPCSMRVIANAMVHRLTRAFTGKTLHSPFEALALAEETVLATIRASALVSLLDFDNLQLELVGKNRMRRTHNRALNKDGTPCIPLSEAVNHSRLTPVGEEEHRSPTSGILVPTANASRHVTCDISDAQPNDPEQRSCVVRFANVAALVNLYAYLCSSEYVY